jgi:hypothetical protein
MCGNYGSAPGHLTTGALHVAPMVVARAFTPPETAWQVGRPVAQAVVPCSNSPGNGRYRCFRGARNSPRESQFWPFNRLPWLGHARLDFGKLNGQRAVPCPRGGVCALRAPRNAASRFWPFFGVAGRFSPLRARAKRPKTAEESAHGRNDGSSVRNDPSITPGGRVGRGRGRTRRPRARPREAYFMGLKNEIGFKKCLSPASSIE